MEKKNSMKKNYGKPKNRHNINYGGKTFFNLHKFKIKSAERLSMPRVDLILLKLGFYKMRDDSTTKRTNWLVDGYTIFELPQS